MAETGPYGPGIAGADPAGVPSVGDPWQFFTTAQLIEQAEQQEADTRARERRRDVASLGFLALFVVCVIGSVFGLVLCLWLGDPGIGRLVLIGCIALLMWGGYAINDVFGVHAKQARAQLLG